MERGRRVRAGDGRPDQGPRPAVDDDRHVAELGLDGIAARARREVGHELEGVDPGVPGALDGHPHERRLGIRVGRPREGPVVGDDRLAHRQPSGQLALVVGLVGVELGSRRIADDRQAVGDAHPPVARVGRPAADVDAVVLQAQVVDREGPADGEQDGVTGRGRPVVEVDDVRAVGSGPGPCLDRPDPGPDGHPVGLERGPDDRRVARVIGRGETRPGLDDRHRDAEPRVDLGQLAAGRDRHPGRRGSWAAPG